MANDKDKATAKRVIKRYLDNDTNDHQLENEFIAALTTVRREARAAALDQACRVTCPRCSMPDRYTPAERVGNGERWFHRAVNTSFEQGIASQCDAWTIRNLTIEAAANDEEGGGDAKRR